MQTSRRRYTGMYHHSTTIFQFLVGTTPTLYDGHTQVDYFCKCYHLRGLNSQENFITLAADASD